MYLLNEYSENDSAHADCHAKTTRLAIIAE
jgi:hypothetical protein